jgi:hypothetical protein
VPTAPRTPSVFALLTAAAAAALPACTLDFDSFLDGSRTTTGPDGGGMDDIAPGSDVPAMTGSCARPYIMIGMTSGLDNDHGRIVRFEVTPNSTRRCDDLRGGGALDRGGWAVADIPGAGILYGYNTGAALIDEAHDRVLWDIPFNDINLISLDAFPLRAPDGTTMPTLAVSDVHAGSENEPWGVRAYDPATGQLRYYWSRDAAPHDPWPSGLQTPMRGFTFNPQSASEALTVVVDSSGAAGSPAMGVNFFTGTTHLFAAAQGTSPIALMTTIAATVGTAQQLVWTGGSDLSQMTGVYYLRFPPGGGAGAPTGPQRCTSLCDTFIHAVPDPSSDVDRFAICSRGSVQRVVRMESCTEVTSTTAEGDNWSFRRLGVAFAQ